MERIIRMRKEVPEIGWGDFTVLDTGTPEVLALRYDWRGNAVVMVHHLGAAPREVSFDAGGGGEDAALLVNLLSTDHSRGDAQGRHTLVLEPYGYRWYRLGGLDYLMRRSEVDKG
jgi:maltose alpha-D-glucosyltransferase/alpha-amylase